MKATPTSGPMRRRNTHQERELISSRHSLRRRQAQAESGERKKDLLKLVCFGIVVTRESAQLIKSAGRNDFAVVQQDEPVTHQCRICNMVDRNKQRPAKRNMFPQY